jgi:hypothetical protein
MVPDGHCPAFNFGRRVGRLAEELPMSQETLVYTAFVESASFFLASRKSLRKAVLPNPVF